MDPIRFEVPSSFIQRVRRDLRRGRFFAAYPKLTDLSSRLGRKLLGPAALASAWRDNEAHCPRANMEVPETVLGYTGDDEVQAWLYYRAQSQRPAELAKSDSGILYEKIVEHLSRLIATHRPPTVLNFGVCYPHVDALLAKRFPETRFVGIDRSPLTKALNDAEFGDIRNLSFVTSDVFEHFGAVSYAQGLLFHTRTTTVLSRPLVERVYQAASKAGFDLIVAIEGVGVSRENMEPYVLDETDKPSRHFRGFMFLHNYPYLLRKAGYNVISSDLFKTGHPDPDCWHVMVAGQRS